MKFRAAFRQIELLIKKVLTVNFWRLKRDPTQSHKRSTNFWCDSHPALCFTCHRVRKLIKGGEKGPPNPLALKVPKWRQWLRSRRTDLILLNVKGGVHVWHRLRLECVQTHEKVTVKGHFFTTQVTDYRRIKHAVMRYTHPLVGAINVHLHGEVLA